MGLILFLILGGLAGWLASIIMHTDTEQGLGVNLLVGSCGALVGGAAFNLVGERGITGFNLWSLVVAFAGSVVLLILLKTVRRAT